MPQGNQQSDEFLSDIELRPLTMAESPTFVPVGLALGSGGLEVAVSRCGHRPQQGAVRQAWRARLRGRAVPVLMVCLYDGRAAICGPGGDEPPVYSDLEVGQVERICRAALAEPDRHAAARFLMSVLPETGESPIPGLRNEGLFANHELASGVPVMPQWREAQENSEPLLSRRGRPLLESLGFQIADSQQQYSILRVGQTKIAVAVFLDRSEATDLVLSRFGGMTAIQYALAKADEENLDYVVVDHGSALRVYTAASSKGVGRRGRTETFVEVHLDLLPSDKAGYLWLLFSGPALNRGGTFEQILVRSQDYAADLGSRLRDRIYDEVVPQLAVAIARSRDLSKPTAQDLANTYEMALLVLFRLLFIAYAEDKGLLPYRVNDLYTARSLKQKAKELADLRRHGNEKFDDSSSLWDEVVHLFKVVDTGKPKEWGVPGYNGGMFSSDAKVSSSGALLSTISLPNRAFGPVLSHLLVDNAPGEGPGPVDFRSLGVREFGTIYEGLLESELSVAETDLTVDKEGLYIPAGRKTPVVRVGEIYLHNASGARKSSGSYYTKSFAVEHLLDHALEPALTDHLARLDKLDDRNAAEAFFDFRVADIAMGSGHFLVAAVDRIEHRFSSYLAKRPLPGVLDELARLRQAAVVKIREASGAGPTVEIENVQLLRRQIARRCVYGVDINKTAVNLARLSLWIHTFVPGLPLSFLDHNVVNGNSLVGIATMDEAKGMLAEGGTLFADLTERYLGPVRDEIVKLARLSDADASQIQAAREAFTAARRAVAEADLLLTVLTASRLPEMDYTPNFADFDSKKVSHARELNQRARKILQDIPPFHFPIAFPEVFLRQRAGFDVILGNPPWEEATVEEDRFWNAYVPGLQARPQHEQETIKAGMRRTRPDLLAEYKHALGQAEILRQVLVTGPYPGMGTGDPDLYKAFCWRFWNLIAPEGGRLGVVLPRSAMSAKGSAPFRTAVLQASAVDVTFMINSAGWVFDDAEWRYTISLANIVRMPEPAAHAVSLRGPFRSLERFRAGVVKPPVRFPADEVLSWTDTAALPLLPGEESALVFAQLRKSPRLDLNDGGQWRARPHTELHATNDKNLMALTDERPAGYWPVFSGESFDHWEPDRGVYYAWADPEKMTQHLLRKRSSGRKRTNSVWFEFALRPPKWFDSADTLPCFSPRIAFKDVVRNTDSRTMKVALIPPRVFITNKGPYFLRVRGDEKDEAYLLGVLSSIPLDWYARRFVELSMNYFILNPFPIPRPGRSSRLWERVVALAGRLSCPDKRFKKWAEHVGVEHGALSEAEKRDMIAELDAVVAHLYGLTEPHLSHIFETFHEGWDYRERLEAVLLHYRAWERRK